MAVEAQVRFSKVQPTIRFEGSRKGEADWLLKCMEEEPRKAFADKVWNRTKTDTGRRGEYPQALERTVLKELGKLTP
jgi:hypothetical protein